MAMWDQSNPVSARMLELLRARASVERYEFSMWRYISRYEGSWKVITDSEWRALADFHQEMEKAGGFCLVGLIYEDNGTPRSAAQGVSDALETRKWISRLEVPVGGSIMYTDDEDGPIGPVMAATGAYFEGLRIGGPDSPFIPNRGLYAGGTMVNVAKQRNLIDTRWITQSLGFNGSRTAIAEGEYEIKQLLSAPYAGQDVDPDVLRPGLKPWDVGAFVPGGGLYSPAVA